MARPAYVTKGRDDRAGFFSRAGARERKHSRRLWCSEHVPARGKKTSEGAAAQSVDGANVEDGTYLIEIK